MNLGRDKLDWSKDIWDAINKIILIGNLYILITKNNLIPSQSEQYS